MAEHSSLRKQDAANVPYVVLVRSRDFPYVPAEIRKAEVLYSTVHTVRIKLAGVTPYNIPSKDVFCLPNEEAWSEVETAHKNLAIALNAIAQKLRALGSYGSQLEKAGGIQKAPNPITPLVVRTEDPDCLRWGSECLGPHDPPLMAAIQIESHTATQLRLSSGKRIAQAGTFCCTEDDWEELKLLLKVTQSRAKYLEDILKNLGTYAEAAHRYKAKPAIAPVEEKADLTATVLALPEQDRRALIRALMKSLPKEDLDTEEVNYKSFTGWIEEREKETYFRYRSHSSRLSKKLKTGASIVLTKMLIQRRTPWSKTLGYLSGFGKDIEGTLDSLMEAKVLTINDVSKILQKVQNDQQQNDSQPSGRRGRGKR
jgi:hypothetical protein